LDSVSRQRLQLGPHPGGHLAERAVGAGQDSGAQRQKPVVLAAAAAPFGSALAEPRFDEAAGFHPVEGGEDGAGGDLAIGSGRDLGGDGGAMAGAGQSEEGEEEELFELAEMHGALGVRRMVDRRFTYSVVLDRSCQLDG
jgi:hypothetical protein